MENHASMVNQQNNETWVVEPNNLLLAGEFCELLLKKREQALGFTLYGGDRWQRIEVDALDLAEAAYMNDQIDIQSMIDELSDGTKDYLDFLRYDQLLEEEGGEPDDDDQPDVVLL